MWPSNDDDAYRNVALVMWRSPVRRARRRCRREWRKALRGAVAEGENRTEYAVVLIPVANREN